MTLDQREQEQKYVNLVKRQNPWFEEKRTVKLTHDQVDYLIRHAYRAALLSGYDPMDTFRRVFGGRGIETVDIAGGKAVSSAALPPPHSKTLARSRARLARL